MSTYKICVLSEGTGFIGAHFVRCLLTNDIAEKVFLADLQPIERAVWPQGLLELSKSEQIEHGGSIAPYGPTEENKDERSLPAPISPYGASKLVAEQIHIAWQLARKGRRLIIVRPGVVFGAGEYGNMTHMIRALLGRYLFHIGNRQTRKAGGYVKELCHTQLGR